jgi:hypothetical protein
VSSVPPIECMELAVEPRLDWYLPLEPGLETISDPSPHIKYWAKYLGNGYSCRESVGDMGERLSKDCLEAAMFPEHSQRDNVPPQA